MSDQAPDWAASLPEEVRPVVQAKGWKTPADIIGSYTNLEKTLGQKRLPTPSADWKDEQWDGFYKELGRPDKPDDYKVPEFKFPDGVAMDDNRLKEAKAAIHAAGLHPRQAEKVMKYYFDMVAKEAESAFEQRRREQEASVFKLKDEWKGDYDNNIKLAKDAFVKLVDDPEAVKRLAESGLGDDPVIIKMFHKLGARMLEDHAAGRASQSGSTLTQESARAKFDTLKNDAVFMNKLRSDDRAVQKAAQKEWEETLAAAFPPEQKAA